MRNHTKLRAFELADEVVLLIYRATREFPKKEVYGLTSQMRRAAISVPLIVVWYLRCNIDFFMFSTFRLFVIGFLIFSLWLFELCERRFWVPCFDRCVKTNSLQPSGDCKKLSIYSHPFSLNNLNSYWRSRALRDWRIASLKVWGVLRPMEYRLQIHSTR